MEKEDENENALTIRGIEGEDPIWPILIGRIVFRRFRWRRGRHGGYVSREDKRAKRINPPYRLYTHRNPPKNIFLDLLWRLLFPRGSMLTGGQRPTQCLATFVNRLICWRRHRLGQEHYSHWKASRMYTFWERMRLQGSECKKKYSRIDCKVSNNF